MFGKAIIREPAATVVAESASIPRKLPINNERVRLSELKVEKLRLIAKQHNISHFRLRKAQLIEAIVNAKKKEKEGDVEIPFEVWMSVMEYMKYPDILALCASSASMNAVCMDDGAWRELAIRQSPKLPYYVKKVRKLIPNWHIKNWKELNKDLWKIALMKAKYSEYSSYFAVKKARDDEISRLRTLSTTELREKALSLGVASGSITGLDIYAVAAIIASRIHPFPEKVTPAVPSLFSSSTIDLEFVKYVLDHILCVINPENYVSGAVELIAAEIDPIVIVPLLLVIDGLEMKDENVTDTLAPLVAAMANELGLEEVLNLSKPFLTPGNRAKFLKGFLEHTTTLSMNTWKYLLDYLDIPQSEIRDGEAFRDPDLPVIILLYQGLEAYKDLMERYPGDSVDGSRLVEHLNELRWCESDHASTSTIVNIDRNLMEMLRYLAEEEILPLPHIEEIIGTIAETASDAHYKILKGIVDSFHFSAKEIRSINAAGCYRERLDRRFPPPKE